MMNAATQSRKIKSEGGQGLSTIAPKLLKALDSFFSRRCPASAGFMPSRLGYETVSKNYL